MLLVGTLLLFILCAYGQEMFGNLVLAGVTAFGTIVLQFFVRRSTIKTGIVTRFVPLNKLWANLEWLVAPK